MFLRIFGITSFLTLYAYSCASQRPEDTYPHAAPTAVAAASEVHVDLPQLQTVCKDGMVEVKGDYCTTASEPCLKYRGPKGSKQVVCEQFGKSTCLSGTVPIDFCVDKYEWPNKAGALPQVKMTWYDAKAACESVGKRLCSEEEITFACEGEELQPYPYGNGHTRDSSACNIDRPELPAFEFIRGRKVERPLAQVDQRMASGSKPACVSPFGVYDIVGNVDEWAYNSKGNEKKPPYFSVLHSGHWVKKARNQCRAVTDSHYPAFSFYVTGTRCCDEARGTP